ncbi:MAG TPA: metallophosphoesterase, partial [Anaerolineaceae bacterium]|nr:metallophosphoesterase [Anaerolineaceae bacterium]
MTLTTHTITILHTNDMHSSLEAMSRLSAYAKQMRRELEEQGHSVFFFDAGDAADRRVRFVGVTKGYAFPPVLAAMGYDLQALGNAISVTYGPQAAAKMAQRAEYPILAGNLFDENGPLLEGFQATQSQALPGGLRLGVIGLTVHAPDIYSLFNLDVPHFIDAARRWAGSLARSGRGPLVVVSHLGIREDRELAAAGLGIDVIIGGHSHTLLPEGEWVDGTLIAQTGQYAENLGRVDLVIDTETGAVLSKSAVVIPIPADTPPDLAVLAAIQSAETEARELLDKPIVEIAERLGLDHFAECAIANLGADALLDRM